MKLSMITISLLNHSISTLTNLRDTIVDYKVNQHINKMNNSSLSLTSTRDI
jgi:hypothetical protein